MTDDFESQMHHALNNIAIRPAGYGYLGKGDSSGEIVVDPSTRAVWYQVSSDQPPVTAPLMMTMSILAINRPEMEGTRVVLGYPPQKPNVLHIIDLDYTSGLQSVGGITPNEQLLSKAMYPDLGSLINLRVSPNDPLDSEVWINPGWYKDVNGKPAFWGGDSTLTLLTAAIAALSSGTHQMAVAYIDTTTGLPTLITNTAEAGGAGDKQVFDTTTIVDMAHAAGEVLSGAVHLYYGQTLITEEDIYRSSDPRMVFDATGTFGSMSSFTVTPTSGTSPVIGDGQTLNIVGSGGIVTSGNSGTKTITIDGSGAGTTPPFIDTTAIVKGSSDATKLLRFEVDGLTTATTRVLTPPDYDGTIATLAGTEALTNKTLTSPVLNTGVSGSAISNDATFASPSSTIVPTTNAVKGYVDQSILGLNAKADVRLATLAALPTLVYANGTAGVGATLTGVSAGVLTIDSVTVALNDRLLVKDQAAGLQNGIYKCTVAGAIGVAFVLTRTTDADTDAELRGGWMIVTEGTVNAGQGFLNTNISTITFGTTAITFGEFSAGAITASNGVLKTGNNLTADSTVIRTTGTQSIANGLTLTTPTIADLSNAQHNHSNAAGGGNITGAAFGTQTANTVLSGPTTGSAAAPTFRAMVLADIPNALITLAKLAVGTKGKFIVFDRSTGAASESYAALDFEVVWGSTIGTLKAVYQTGSYWLLMSSGGTSVGLNRGIRVDTGPGTNLTGGDVRTNGFLAGSFGLAGGQAYVSGAGTGALTASVPTPTLDSSGVVIIPLGWGVDGGIMVNTLQPVTYRQFTTMAASAIVSVTHYADAAYARRVAVLGTFYTDTVSDTYASSNQDVSIPLRGPATGVTTIDSTGAALTWLGNSGGVDRRAAQSFQVTGVQRVSQWTVRFGATTGSPTGVVNWSIQTDAAGIPSGTSLASGTFTPTASADNTITVTAQPILLSATPYHFVMQSANAQISGNFWQFQYNATGAYASGSLKIDTGTAGTYLGTWALGGSTNDLRSTFTTITTDGLAQSFTASTSASLTRFRLWMKRTGSPTGTLTGAIYSDSAGMPGSVITNGTAATVLASTLGTSYGYIEFAYSVPPPALVSGTVYHLVLTTSDAASATNYVEWGADQSSPSLTGAMETLTSSTWALMAPTTDACFEVYRRDVTYLRELPLGDYDTGTNGYGWTPGDSSGANTNTITRIKNLGAPREMYIDVILP